MKLGFVINPMAGIGGAVALKGSDGTQTVAKALALGATPQAQQRAYNALKKIDAKELIIYTAAHQMGEAVLKKLSLPYQLVHQAPQNCSAIDTKQTITHLIEKKVDGIIFVGGDGTARDVYDVVKAHDDKVNFFIGIPAGVKIHSAVYAVTPERAGELFQALLEGEIMSLQEASVMDLDEKAFRQGRVNARCYGYLPVPIDNVRMQQTKQGGLNIDQLVVQDIATEIIETMLDDVYYLVGSGTTTAEIMQQLNLPNTLLGVDVVQNQNLVASDVDEATILKIIKQHKAKIIVTPIGGQGHVFGRGNQQLSAKVIQQVERKNIIIIASIEKLQSLKQQAMIADTGDLSVDESLAGFYDVITGYQQSSLYRLI